MKLGKGWHDFCACSIIMKNYKDLKDKSGIYQIRNIKNGKLYIGSAKDLYTRQKVHFSLLENNKHHSKHFQNAWNKENEKDAFVFEVIEFVDDLKLLIDKELYYLNILGKANDYLNNINSDFLELTYNIKPTSNRGFIGKHSEETRKKLSKANPFQKPIIVFDNFGKLIKTCKNGSEVMKITECSRNAILSRCKLKRFVLNKGYLVCFEEDINEIMNFINSSKKPIISNVWNKGKSTKNCQKFTQSVKIKVFDVLENTEKLYECMNDFATEIGANNSNIHRFISKGNKKSDLYKKRYKIMKI